ncbi:hypothetical protein BaRGS_00011401, partial [Batillaria attramentaria]
MYGITKATRTHSICSDAMTHFARISEDKTLRKRKADNLAKSCGPRLHLVATVWNQPRFTVMINNKLLRIIKLGWSWQTDVF